MIAPEDRSPWWDLAIAVVPVVVTSGLTLAMWVVDRRERKAAEAAAEAAEREAVPNG